MPMPINSLVRVAILEYCETNFSSGALYWGHVKISVSTWQGDLSDFSNQISYCTLPIGYHRLLFNSTEPDATQWMHTYVPWFIY
jgi:hypothetical protein